MNGILLVDKPIGWTSHDVVDFIRKKFKINKAGHGGTLDPIAMGLLVVFLGSATKSAKLFENDPKEYVSVMGLGYETFTNDGTGKIIDSRKMEYIPKDLIIDTFSRFTGKIEQAPPLVSAIKHKGKRLYKLAMAGKEIDPSPRIREIFCLDILHYHFPYIMFRIECSKGTYVRKLCSDIGIKMGCYGYMSSLIRTKSGDFNLSNALTIPILRKLNSEELKKYIIDVSRITVKLNSASIVQ